MNLAERYTRRNPTILGLAMSLILGSCVGDFDIVSFEKPQPEGLSNEKGLPKRFAGEYISLNDSSRLTITPRLIIKYTIEDFSGRLDSSDLKETKGDTSYSVKDSKITFNIRVKGDSAFQTWIYNDTLFDASRGDVLRKYKGRYFLNKQLSADSWWVRTLTKIDNGVTLGSISTKEEIDNLRELTQTKSDSVYSFRPTKKELRKFLKANGFSDKDTYIKIR